MTDMQLDIYKQFVQSTTTRRLIADADMGQKKTASRILTVHALITPAAVRPYATAVLPQH